jgi:hypothetical protein
MRRMFRGPWGTLVYPTPASDAPPSYIFMQAVGGVVA